jgi:signal peptidase II
VRRVPVNRLTPARTPFVVASVTVVADLIASSLARHNLAARGDHIVGPVWIRLSYNRGISFSVAREWPFVAALAAIVALAIMTVLAVRSRHGAPAIGFGLVVGGGFGNLIDRVAASPHAVADYVVVGSFPSFNLADAAITVGIVILFIAALRGKTLLRSR